MARQIKIKNTDIWQRYGAWNWSALANMCVRPFFPFFGVSTLSIIRVKLFLNHIKYVRFPSIEPIIEFHLTICIFYNTCPFHGNKLNSGKLCSGCVKKSTASFQQVILYQNKTYSPLYFKYFLYFTWNKVIHIITSMFSYCKYKYRYNIALVTFC